MHYQPRTIPEQASSTTSRSTSSSVFLIETGAEYDVKESIYVYPTKEMPVSKEEMALTAMTVVYPGDIIRVLAIDWDIIKIRLVKHATHELQIAYITRNILKKYFRKR